MRWCSAFQHIADAVGVAHLNKPIGHCRRNAIVEAVESAILPRGNLLFLGFAFYVVQVAPRNADTYLGTYAQPQHPSFALVGVLPFTHVDIKQDRHF